MPVNTELSKSFESLADAINVNAKIDRPQLPCINFFDKKLEKLHARISSKVPLWAFTLMLGGMLGILVSGLVMISNKADKGDINEIKADFKDLKIMIMASEPGGS